MLFRQSRIHFVIGGPQHRYVLYTDPRRQSLSIRAYYVNIGCLATYDISLDRAQKIDISLLSKK